MTALQVFANDLSVGTLEVKGGVWSFDYAPGWSEYALSPTFPLQSRNYRDTNQVRRVEWFFENLLPEGRLREQIAVRDRIDPGDTWAMLVRHGRDTAGALSLIPMDAGATALPARYVPISRVDLQIRIEESRRRNLPLMAAWEDIRMSLAGAQEKLGLFINSRGEIYLPEGTAASTHIVKPENVSSDFPYCPANEFFCMRLAAELKIPVPEVDLLHLPEPLYVTTRFDRMIAPNQDSTDTGYGVRRLHQIDLCQALGVPPSQKYESEGGLGLSQLVEFLNQPYIDRPAVAVNAVVQWVAFNYLIGNLDAHAKNISFLMRGQKAAVAPFYDLLCVEAYLPRIPLSMAIAGENKPGWVEGVHWDAFAYEAGVAPRLIRDVLTRMAAIIPDAIARVIGDERLLPAEREFIREKIFPVIEERRTFIGDALRERPATLKQLIESHRLASEVEDRLRQRSS